MNILILIGYIIPNRSRLSETAILENSYNPISINIPNSDIYVAAPYHIDASTIITNINPDEALFVNSFFIVYSTNNKYMFFDVLILPESRILFVPVTVLGPFTVVIPDGIFLP